MRARELLKSFIVSATQFAQAREYSPQQGRLISEDRIKGIQTHPFTLNPYSYCWSQPLNLVDLDGFALIAIADGGGSRSSSSNREDDSSLIQIGVGFEEELIG